jgi:type II secretory ATPase GspE/PulE/Tfp pilus assembly ATPase PilB-like protein
MHIEPFLVASTVNIIMAQRLVRKTCQVCRTNATYQRSELIKNMPEALITKYFGQNETIQAFKGTGCKLCHTTGYSGRIGVFEVLEVSKEIKKLITQKFDSDVIKEKAKEEGMMTMLEDGLEKITKGLTTIEEIIRVTKVEK